MDASVKSVLGGYPAPNSYSAGDGLNTGAYQWNSPVQVRGPQYMVRLDHTITDKHTLWGRWLGAEQNTLGGDPLNSRPQVLPGYPARGEVFRPAHNIAVGLRSILTPRVVNELTLGFSRFSSCSPRARPIPASPIRRVSPSTTPTWTTPPTRAPSAPSTLPDRREYELHHRRARLSASAAIFAFTSTTISAAMSAAPA